MDHSTDKDTKKRIEVNVQVFFEEGKLPEYHIMVSGDTDDRIKDGDIVDAATVIEDAVKRRISWAR